MNKKKIAFVLNKMDQGGPARVFLNFCYLINEGKYEISLFLSNPGGSLYNEIPQKIKINLFQPRGLFCSSNENLKQFIIWGPVRIIIKLIGFFKRKLTRINADTTWVLFEYFIKKDETCYDLAMSLREGRSNYFLADFIKSKVKIGRIPTDYNVAKFNNKFDFKYFSKLNYIVTNSLVTLKFLTGTFSSISERFFYLKTVTLPEILRAKAIDGDVGFTDNFDGIRILTLSRLDITKGTDLAIQTCRILVDMGLNVRWYFMGNGPQKKYHQKIKKMKLDNHFIIYSVQSNPYPFLAECDIYVHPSLYEGNSNSVNEAKAFAKPIILTNFDTASEHVINNIDGLISKNEPSLLANDIKMMIENDELKCKLRNNLMKSFNGNIHEIDKILKLIK